MMKTYKVIDNNNRKIKFSNLLEAVSYARDAEHAKINEYVGRKLNKTLVFEAGSLAEDKVKPVSASLLDLDTARRLSNNILIAEYKYWLSTPMDHRCRKYFYTQPDSEVYVATVSTSGDFDAAFVGFDGSKCGRASAPIKYWESKFHKGATAGYGVRPVITVDKPLTSGKEYTINDYDFICIAPTKLLSKYIIGYSRFDKADNNYNGSDIKQFVDRWFNDEIANNYVEQ